MKKLFKWLIVLFIPLLGLTFTACGSDDNDEPDQTTSNDPVGTVMVSMKFTESQYVDRTEDGAWSSSAYTYFIEYPISISNKWEIRLTSYGTLKGGSYKSSDGFKYNRDENHSDGTEFASVPSAKSLGDLKTLPEYGWASEVAAIPGNGFVAKNGSDYCRIYVVDYLYNSSNSKIGVVLKYQFPFIP